MGLGKTVQTLAFIQYMVQSNYVGPNLIVVPTSVLPNWEREAEKFVPGLKRLTIYGKRLEAMCKYIATSDPIDRHIRAAGKGVRAGVKAPR